MDHVDKTRQYLSFNYFYFTVTSFVMIMFE